MQFPLDLRFKTFALAPQISVRDAAGQLVFYVRQKAFKLKEAVTIFADEAQTRALYTITADRVFDISARYHIAEHGGRPVGTIQRRGLKSIWRAQYEVHDAAGASLVIREEKPWVKLIDGLIGEVPVLGMVSGYIFHPAYIVTGATTGVLTLRLRKQPAFLEGRYTIERVAESPDDKLAVLSLLMLVLLERERG